MDVLENVRVVVTHVFESIILAFTVIAFFITGLACSQDLVLLTAAEHECLF
jgi:uncharacterized membrane protein YwzB